MTLDNKNYPSIFAVSATVCGKQYGAIVMTSDAKQIRPLLKKQFEWVKDDLSDDDIIFSANQLLIREGVCTIL